ncbi:hypothetical protein SMC26_17840 [Actinomadura fulvescens]
MSPDTTPGVDPEQIRAECEAVIMSGVFGGYDAALGYFARVKAVPGMAVVGPVMAETFADAIQRSATAAGAVLHSGVADVRRFLPSERHAYARLPAGIPLETRLQGRGIHRAMQRHAHAYVTARARGEDERASAVLNRLSEDQLGQLVFMLWATAMQAARAALAHLE